MKNIALIVSLSIIFQGCATAYRGPGPNLSLKGTEAQEEIKKFHFNESFWSQGSYFEMGPDEKRYTIDSVLFFMDKVSPDAVATIERAKKRETFALVFYGMGVIAFITALNTSDLNQRLNLDLVALGGFVTSLGFTFSYQAGLSHAAGEYNRDLQKKLSPTLGLNVKF